METQHDFDNARKELLLQLLDWKRDPNVKLGWYHQSILDSMQSLLMELDKVVWNGPRPLDDPYLQELFGSTIDGAIAKGFQGAEQPPEGHWLTRWWQLGRDGVLDARKMK